MNWSRFKDWELDDLYAILWIGWMPDLREMSESEKIRYAILAKVRDAVLDNYTWGEIIHEIQSIVKIYPDGPKLLSAAQTIEEFNDCLQAIYQVVLAWQTSYEQRVVPKNTIESWPWYKERTFHFDDGAKEKGFPKVHKITSRTINAYASRVESTEQ